MAEIPHDSACATNAAGWTVWLTGLSGSGKSTLARGIANHLEKLSLEYELLDGDELRRGLCQDLGFSKRDRDENVHRIGYLARLLNKRGIICVVAAIAPYRKTRAEVRKYFSRFLEVHVDCSLDALIRRDVKGLYRRALAGEISNFSGVTDPYEPPLAPDLYLNTEVQSQQRSLELIVAKLESLQWIPAGGIEHPIFDGHCPDSC